VAIDNPLLTEVQKNLEKELPKGCNPYQIGVPNAAAKYLILMGWEPKGDVNDPNVLWVDPTQPEEGKVEWLIKYAPHLNGTTWEDRPVQVKDKNNAMVPVKQPHITFPGRDYTLNEALVIQRDRERQKRRQAAEAEHAKKKKEAKKEEAVA
jgi:hypothetical protein